MFGGANFLALFLYLCDLILCGVWFCKLNFKNKTVIAVCDSLYSENQI